MATLAPESVVIVTLSLQSVSLKLGQTPILNNVSFKVPPGQITTILGPNGAGKSTALKILSGDITSSHGQALLNGRNIASLPAKSLAKYRAVLPQHTHIAFPLKVWELVKLGRAPFHDNDCQKMQYVTRALDAVEAQHLSDRQVTTLSGGERQRVFLAKALTQIFSPEQSSFGKYLLLDEPSSALDLKQTETVMNIVKHIAKDGVGIVMIIHDITTARRYSDHVILLKNGQLFNQGSPISCLTAKNIAQLYDIKLQSADSVLA